MATSLLLNNDVSQITLNDYDKSIYAFWYAVINHSEKLIDLVQNTEISIEEWYRQKEIQSSKENNNNLLELGFSTLFLNRTNRSGILKAGVIGGKNQDGHYKLDCRFNKDDICLRIEKIAKYKKQIKLYNLDAEVFIKKSVAHTKNSLIFLDPPYYEKGSGLYTIFYKHCDHQSLSDTIHKHLHNKNWILTYDNTPHIYRMYKDYRHHQYYLNYSITTPSKGIEYIFYSSELNIGDISKHLKLAI